METPANSAGRKKLLALAVIVTLLILADISGGPSQTDTPKAASTAPATAGMTTSAPPTPPKTVLPSLQPSFNARVGRVDASTNGLDADRLKQASKFGKWLTMWEDLGFERADPSDLRDMAADYKGTGLGGKKVRTLLQDAAKLIESGETAADTRRYQTALTNYNKATQKLEAVPPLLRGDLKKAETLTGARISPHAGERYDGYDYLFPVETTTQKVSVLGWIDGDTVQTSAGRVRLIGIDTPEMKQQCSPAQWAKHYSESLAPAGSSITLTNPKSVKDTDRYDRLLRYVDVPSAAGGGDIVIDVGSSLIRSSLGVARYDSRDGYQWHPREQLYRNSSKRAVEEESAGCSRNAEKAAFILASTFSKDEDSPEYWHRRILGKILLAPYKSARKYLPNAVAETREKHEQQDRLERAAQQREREAQQREREAQQPDQQDSENTDENSEDNGGAEPDPGYNGPRCYAPGGKTWTPC